MRYLSSDCVSKMNRFTFYDVFISVLSTTTYITDVGTDVWLIVYFFLNGHSVWGALTLGFVAMAAVMMQVFSFHWHVADRSLNWKTFIVHILFLAPLHRYLRLLKLGFKSRSSGKAEDLNAAYREMNDICILRLFETFLESAPQLVLQLYIICSDLNNFGPVIGISTVFSLLSVAWAVTAYTDALHLAYKKLYKRSVGSMITHVVWQAGMVTSRVFSIVLFATAFHSFVTIPLALHWIIMMIWIAFLKPEFGSSPCERRLFMFVAALIHTFCFLNLKDGPSRWRLLFYHSLTLVENVIFVTMWFMFQTDTVPDWFQIMAFSVVIGGFAIGAACLLSYYGCCHPSGPAPLSVQKPELHKTPSLLKDQDLKRAQLPIFDVSSTSARINLWLSASLDLSKEGLVENPDESHHLNNTPGNHGDSRHENYTYGHSASLQTSADVHVSPQESTRSPNAGKSLPDMAMYTSYLDNTHASGRSRSTMYAADDRLDYSRTSRAKLEQQQELSMPDYNLVEMFSRCKLDPSFVSSASFNDSGLHQSYQNVTEDKELSLGAFVTSPNHSSLNNQSYGQNSSSLSKQSNHSSLRKGRQSMEFSPVSISPLDPNKLWEESRMTMEPSLRSNFMYQAGSDPALHKYPGDSTASIMVMPDTSRGITHLSLSYSALDKDDMYNSRRNNRSGLSDTDSSFFQTKGRHKSRDSMNKTSHSEGISFSNLSLPLPDGSADCRSRHKNPPDIVKCSSPVKSAGNTGNRNNLSNKGKSLKSSPYGQDTKNSSADSFYSRDYSPSDRQSSYLSDRGLSSSDRGLSSNESSNDRSHRSLTSSGFQSEESNMSGTSPTYANGCLRNQNHQFQSTPIVENEISSIYEMPSTIRSKRESLDQDVLTPYSQVENEAKPITSRVPVSSVSKKPVSSLFFYSEACISPGSPELPPLRLQSRRSSSATSGSTDSGKFFKDPTLSDNDSQNDIRSEEGCLKHLLSINSGRQANFSSFTEKSSLSAFLSDLSSSRCGGRQSSDETMSMGSDPELRKKSPYLNQSWSRMKKASSLPYMAHKDDSNNRTINNDIPLYENIDNYSLDESSTNNNNTNSRLQHRRPVSDSAPRLDYMGLDAAEQTKLKELFMEMSGATSELGTSDDSERSDYANICVQNLTTQEIEDMDDSPCGIGRSVDMFDRDRWRASLDKEMKDRQVHDMEKLAPKKLYQLRSKNGTPKKKMPPMTISEYTDSPYKFRKSAGNSSNYENLKNISPASISSEYENIHSLTHAIYTDYENVFDISREKTGKCPIARPESLSDSVLLDNNLENEAVQANDLNKYNNDWSSKVRGEISQDSLNYASMSSRSSDLSRTMSPINTSGINSAFKPVKTRKSLDDQTLKHKGSSNATFDVYDESSSISPRSLSNARDSSSEQSSRSLQQKSGKSNLSQDLWGMEDTCNSTFQWSHASGTDSMANTLDMSHQTPRNYLELAGKAPLSFSMSSFPQDENSSHGSQLSYSDSNYQHSYSDSIPWEDTDNKTNSFQSTTDQNNSKYLIRQPLKALENTPVFSPIYGQDRRLSIELTSRKRFMSTPKLSTGSEMSVSQMSADQASLSEIKTPHRRQSSGRKNKTYSDNTSTWSSQSDYDSELMTGAQNNSSLSKTTYI